ncbi:hypothetical protein [Streptomyces sp. 7N604]|uniref:hypothetical protein n=1 Tax=Streptomyces sp. 7N604 TaxID=3457415 RepID=UPI003FCFA32C
MTEFDRTVGRESWADVLKRRSDARSLARIGPQHCPFPARLGASQGEVYTSALVPDPASRHSPEAQFLTMKRSYALLGMIRQLPRRLSVSQLSRTTGSVDRSWAVRHSLWPVAALMRTFSALQKSAEAEPI